MNRRKTIIQLPAVIEVIRAVLEAAFCLKIRVFHVSLFVLISCFQFICVNALYFHNDLTKFFVFGWQFYFNLAL